MYQVELLGLGGMLIVPAVPASLGCMCRKDNLEGCCGILLLRCLVDVMVDASESLSLTLMTRSATVCCKLVIRAICCSILSLANLLEAASSAIICICWAIIVSNLNFLMDFDDAFDESKEAVGESVRVS